MKLTLVVTASAATIATLIDASRNGFVHSVVIDGGGESFDHSLFANNINDAQQELPLVPTPAERAVAPMPVTQPEPTDEADNAPADPGAPLVDSSGMPWDARIHASSKGTVADGTWRMKRNVDKAIVDAVVAELLGQQPQPVVTPPMPVMPVEPVAQPTPMPVAQPEPEPAAAAAPVTGGPITIPEFMQHLSVKMTGPDAPITNEYLAEAVGKFNAAYGTTFVTVNDFFTAPDKLPALVQMITLDGKW